MKKRAVTNPPKRLTITLPPDLAEWVSSQAKLRGLTASELMTEAVRHWREAGVRKRPRITKAISDSTSELTTGRYET